MELRNWPDRLCNGPIAVLHSPGPQVVSKHCQLQRVAELALYAHVGISGVVLADQRAEQHVAHGVSRDESGLAPGASDFEIERSGDITGMQVLFGKRPRLMHRACGDRQPIEEWVGRQV